MPQLLGVKKQFTVFLINKPGRLAQVCSELARHKVNIIALTVMDTTEHGVLRMVVEQPDQAREILAALNLEVTETDVLVVEMPNRPGAMAAVTEQLAHDHINIHYAYVSSGAAGGRTLGVFKVSDLRKAEKVITTAPERHRDLPRKLRPTPSRKG
jgi:hypothetical protein